MSDKSAPPVEQFHQWGAYSLRQTTRRTGTRVTESDDLSMSQQLGLGMTKATYEIVFDGGSLGNPGKGYGSFHITGPDGVFAHEQLDFGDNVTNNQAEYRTLVAALEYLADRLGAATSNTRVVVRGDSQLVINQVTGKWKVKKAELMPLKQAVVDHLRQFGDVDIAWHGRNESVKLLGH